MAPGRPSEKVWGIAMDDSERESDISRELERVDRRIRIERLKREAEEISGGEIVASNSGEDEDSPIAEEFWERVVEFEKAPRGTFFAQLQNAGVSLPTPDSMNDDELHDKLWEAIHKLAELRVFLNHTDHLSDREFYSMLWNDLLREEMIIMPRHPGSAYHLDVIGSGSEEDIQIGLKYYDDEAYRAHWHESFPEDSIPDHEDPPFDRDAYLPVPDYGL
jgi:hypothetical protein